jgi:16S rRNA (adenine1518-N6/adenine1519-N6)-dimethyltransferase
LPKPRAQIGIADPALFEAVVRDAFGQRRKTLRNALQQQCGGDDIVAAGLRPDARAEQLAVSDFVALANHLAARPSTARLP